MKEGDGAADDDTEHFLCGASDDKDGELASEFDGGFGDSEPSKEADGAAEDDSEVCERGDAAAVIVLLLHLDLIRFRNPVSRDGSGLFVPPKL